MRLRLSLHPALLAASLILSLTAAPCIRADAIADARERWNSGEPRAALLILKDSLQEHDQPAARALLGQIYLDLASGAAAEQELLRALVSGSIDPAEYRTDLAQARLMQGKFEAVVADPAPDSNQAPARRAELLAIRGEAWLALGKPDQAAKEFERALELVPDHPHALLGLAKRAVNQDDTVQARELVERAIKANPRDASAWEARGELALSEGDPVAAEAAFTEAITYSRRVWMPLYKRALARLDLDKLSLAQEDIERAARQLPKFPGLNFARGLLLLKQNRPEEALAEFNTFLLYRPEDPQVIYLAGAALFQLQRYQEAEKYLAGAVRAAPDSATYATLLARVRLARGDLSGAEGVLRPLADQQPADPEVLKILGEVLVRADRPREAGTFLRAALSVQPKDSRTSLKLALALLADGDREGAERELRALLYANPTDEAAQVSLMRLLLDGSDLAAARAQAEQYLAALPQSPRAQIAAGLVCLAQGDEAGARQSFRHALELEPGFADAAFNLATLERRGGATGNARDLYGEVLGAAPRDASAILLLAQLDVDDGHPEAARNRIRDALAKDPDNLSLRLNLVQGYLSAGAIMEALRVLQDAPSAAADDPRVLLARGRLEMATGQPFNAAAAIETLVNRQPGSAEVRLLLADAYAAAGQTASIVPHLLAGIQADPDSPMIAPTSERVYLALPDLDAKRGLVEQLRQFPTPPPGLPLLEARLCLDQGDYPQAQERLGALLRERPEERTLLFLLLKAQAKGEALEAAAETAQTWLASHPDDDEVARRLAQVLAMRNLPDQAIAAYQDLVRRTPTDPVARNNLAMLLLERDPAQAVEQARAALQAVPENPAINDTLGEALLAAGDPQAAAEALARANGLAPKNPAIAFHYARALVAAGAPERARAVLQPMMGQPFPEEEAARSLLSQLGD